MVISISGMDNSGKTTQVKRLIEKYSELFKTKIHINDTSTFDKEKFDYEWWFNKSSPLEFTRTIYKCLEERIEYAKSIDEPNKVVIIEKGLDFYEARILSTLISKGLNIFEAIILQMKVRQEFKLDDIEEIKFYLKPGNYKRETDISNIDQYKTYLENNKILLNLMNINYEYIDPGEIDKITNEIIQKVIERRCDNYGRKLKYRLSIGIQENN